MQGCVAKSAVLGAAYRLGSSETTAALLASVRALSSKSDGPSTKQKGTAATSLQTATPVHSAGHTLLPGQFLVGAPHPISNIRPLHLYVPHDETLVEKRYREMRENGQRQDHEFWLDNNRRFERGRQEFEQKVVADKGQCTLDDLSLYYRQYQVDSYDRHLAYNRAVWRRNLAMVVPGLRAWWAEVWRRRRRRGEGVARYAAAELAPGEEGSGEVERTAKNAQPSTAPASDAGAAGGSVDRRAEKIKSYY
ncbi:hypothetical protein GGI07_003513 [Coemansia sp. Benny D115]|nr:hypothetical protein GGI07_003513 [Coemansia sp. Benny D115]